jgi:PmbA protein
MSDRNLDLAQKIIDLALSLGADSADAVVGESASLNVSCRLGQLEDTERSESRDLGLRAIIGQQQAFVSGTAVDAEALQRLAERAVEMAKATPADRYCGLAPADRLAKDFPALDLADDHEPSAAELQTMAQETEDTARAMAGITNSEGAGAAWGRGTTALVTSHGFAGSYSSTSFSLSCSVVAGTGDNMERDYASHSARHLEDLDTPETIGMLTGERTVARLNPRKLESMKMPIVYDTRVSASLLGHLSAAISGSAIARGTSFLRDAMDTQIMTAGLSVIDEPHRARGLRSAAFDGEGLSPETLNLVQDGVLQSWLLDTTTARQLELESNARAARGVGGPPSPSATNLYLAAGTQAVASILRDVGEGFFVTELIGMGVNGATGDYSRGASGFRIENGELTYAVSEVTIAGNLKDMFRHMTPADDLSFRRGVNAPTVLVEGMTLAGL